MEDKNLHISFALVYVVFGQSLLIIVTWRARYFVVNTPSRVMRNCVGHTSAPFQRITYLSELVGVASPHSMSTIGRNILDREESQFCKELNVQNHS